MQVFVMFLLGKTLGISNSKSVELRLKPASV